MLSNLKRYIYSPIKNKKIKKTVHIHLLTYEKIKPPPSDQFSNKEAESTTWIREINKPWVWGLKWLPFVLAHVVYAVKLRQVNKSCLSPVQCLE